MADQRAAGSPERAPPLVIGKRLELAVNSGRVGRRAIALLLAAWLGPLLLSATLTGARALAQSWVPAPVPAFCDALPFSVDEQAPPSECEPAAPWWVDRLERATRFTEELISAAVCLGLALAVSVVVMTRRERAVDPRALLAYRLGVVTLVLVGGGLVVAGALLLFAVALFPIRG